MHKPAKHPILYEDDDIIVVNKPPNLLSVPGLATPENLWDDIKQTHPTALVVHRLDMATSGIMVFALHKQAQSHIAKQFEKRVIKKKYTALVYGRPPSEYGEICSPLICDWANRPKQKVDWQNGKAALTQYRIFEKDLNKEICRVELFPHTGRSHQLRVHMQQLGCPIVGDYFYSPKDLGLNEARLRLHATTIDLYQPSTNEYIKIHSEPSF